MKTAREFIPELETLETNSNVEYNIKHLYIQWLDEHINANTRRIKEYFVAWAQVDGTEEKMNFRRKVLEMYLSEEPVDFQPEEENSVTTVTVSDSGGLSSLTAGDNHSIITTVHLNPSDGRIITVPAWENANETLRHDLIEAIANSNRELETRLTTELLNRYAAISDRINELLPLLARVSQLEEVVYNENRNH